MKKTILSLMIATGFLTSAFSAQACTSLKLPTTDGGYVYGRTLEFGINLQSEMMYSPRNVENQGVGADGKAGTGLNWTSKYAYAGLNALGQPVAIDGINEVGLSGGLLNAPNTAVYQKTTSEQSKNSIASYQMLSYVLSNFATVDEVKNGLPKIFVNTSGLASYKGIVQVRMTLHDAKGKSLVVEYLNGQLVMTDNPVGVMTNDPAFTWHLQNIGNYANLTPVEKNALVVNGTKFAPPSSGSGLHGLPGDSLSTSRFIRATAYVASAPAQNTATQVNTVMHIMNNFDIPPGSIQLPATNPYGGGAGGFESTEWTSVADAKNLKYYVRTFENPTPQVFDLKKADPNGKSITFKKLNRSVAMESLN